MEITKSWLQKNNVCSEGLDWFLAQDETDAESIITYFINDWKTLWADWLIVRCLSKENKIRYALHAAELVLDIFEERKPKDLRPLLALQAARNCINDFNEETKSMAATCSFDSGAAAVVVENTPEHRAAAFAAYCCAASAYFMDNPELSANFASHTAEWADQSIEGHSDIREQIVIYGLVLLEEQESQNENH